MEQNKEDIFKRFLAKAEKRAEEKKIHRTCLVRVPSMDERPFKTGDCGGVGD